MGNVDKRSPLSKHLSSEGVTEQMGACMRGINARFFKSPGDKGGDGLGIGKTPTRSFQANEDMAAGTSGPVLFEVRGNGLSNIRGQRESSRSISFPSDGDFPCLPMEIIQSEADDLAGPQAQSSEQEENCIITTSLGRSTVTLVQDLLNLVGLKELWQGRKLPVCDGGNAGCQVGLNVTSMP